MSGLFLLFLALILAMVLNQVIRLRRLLSSLRRHIKKLKEENDD